MHELPQDLALELLILPSVVFGIGTSVVRAMQLRRVRIASDATKHDALDLAVGWHLLLPIGVVIVAGRMLAIDHGDWLEFLDQPQTIVVLLASLAVCGPNCGLRYSTDFRTISLWRILSFHVVGLVSALLCMWIFTEVVTGFFLLETSVATAETDSVFTGTPWSSRLEAWPRVLLPVVMALALAVVLWNQFLRSHVEHLSGNVSCAVLGIAAIVAVTWSIARSDPNCLPGFCRICGGCDVSTPGDCNADPVDLQCACLIADVDNAD